MMCDKRSMFLGDREPVMQTDSDLDIRGVQELLQREDEQYGS